jgi:hypothetical protein
MLTTTGEYKGVPIHPRVMKEVLEQFEYKGEPTMTYWPAPKAFWKRLRSKWPAGKRTGEMGLLKDHLRCISEREWIVVEEAAQLSIRNNNRVSIREMEIHGTNTTTEGNR